MDRFEDQLKSTSREMDMFMKKDPPVLTMDEMRGSVQVIDKLDARAKQVSTLNNDQKQPTQLTKKIVVSSSWVYIVNCTIFQTKYLIKV